MVTTTEDPRLSVTVTLHAPEHGSRLKCVLTSSQRPSVLAAVWAGMSTWPVEVMDTEYSALVLTSYPVTNTLNRCPLKAAATFASRSELPPPMVIVSCWVPDGPGIWPRLFGWGVICTVKE